MTDENKVPSAPTAADANDAGAAEPAAENEGAVLLRRISELKDELEHMRAELGTAYAVRPERTPRPPVPSAGDLTGADDSLFSPAEVRAMSRSEVRANLGRIRESMRHWN